MLHEAVDSIDAIGCVFAARVDMTSCSINRATLAAGRDLPLVLDRGDRRSGHVKILRYRTA